MQGPKRRTPTNRRISTGASKGRVVDLHSWKAQKRSKGLRGKRLRPIYFLTAIAALFALSSAGFALFSCVPSSFQVQSMILAWFFAALGIVVGLALYVLRDRYAKRWLLAYLVSMAWALVAAAAR